MRIHHRGRNNRNVPGGGITFLLVDGVFIILALTGLPQRLFTQTRNLVIAAVPVFVSAIAAAVAGRIIFKRITATRGEEAAKKLDTICSIVGALLGMALFALLIHLFNKSTGGY